MGFYFPSLITALCCKVGVKYGLGEEVLQPKLVMDVSYIQGISDWRDGYAVSSSRARASSFSTWNRVFFGTIAP